MTLKDVAKTIRSKNAGVDHITFDIIFEDKEKYESVKNSNKITKNVISKLYSIPEDLISVFTFFDPGLAIKFSIKRSCPSGSPGDADTYGCQQYAPLLDIKV